MQVAEALDYANRQGVLHRDVKPSNLLLDNHGNVWVADFGLAKTAEADDLTHTGDILGTIRYMAPERFQGKCDARSDVYSLGLTLYELVALRPAYEAADRHALIQCVLHEEPERLKKLATAVPRDLETIIAKASAREPAGRYDSASALAEDLKRFIEDRPIWARRVSAAERLSRWCRRNPWIAGSMGVAAAALVAAVVVSLLYADRQARLATVETLRADEQTRHAEVQAQAAAKLKTALSESDRRLAMLNFERGRIAFERGHIGEGMVWTVESLRMATAAGAEDWKRVALANLAAWRRQLTEPKGVYPRSHKQGSVALSPNGKTILAGINDNKTAQMYDAASGRPLGQPLEHPDEVYAMAFSPDGKTILTGCGDKTARLWDAASGRPLGEPMRHDGLVSSVAFSPDGKTILTGCGDKTARLWDAASGRPLGEPMRHADFVTSVAFSPDGKLVLTGSRDKMARLWDAASGRPLGEPMRHSETVSSVAFSPDGKLVLSGGWFGMARLWDAATGRPLGSPITTPGGVSSAAFSPDGQTIVTAAPQGQTVSMWDVATGQRLERAMEHRGTVYPVVLSPDGRSILTGSRDGTARLWDYDVGHPVGRVLDYGTRVWPVVFSRDGKTIVTGTYYGQVRLWDVASGHRIGPTLELGSAIYRIALSPDGKTILTVSMDGTARLWDVATGRQVGQTMEHGGGVHEVAFSPDGQTVLTGSQDATARLWDAATGRPLGPPLEHGGVVHSVAFGPDGKTVLTGCGDTMARLWDTATGRLLGQPMPHEDPVISVAFSPDGRTIVAGCVQMARLWDTATGRPLGQPLEHSGEVSSVAFSPDGKTVVTGSRDKTARLWDTATGRPLGPPLEHGDSVWFVAFGPDGRSVLMGGERIARVWDAPAALPDDPPRLAAWAEAATGLELDERGSIRVLDYSAWLERRRYLEQLGGPPPADPAPRLDPILFGADPAARGDGWKEREQWDRADAAYAEAIRARPLNPSAWAALARWHVARGRLDEATATLGEAIQMMPDDLELRRHFGVVLLASGDRAGWRCLNAALLESLRRHEQPMDRQRGRPALRLGARRGHRS